MCRAVHPPPPGFKFIQNAFESHTKMSPFVEPRDFRDCSVVMMIGMYIIYDVIYVINMTFMSYTVYDIYVGRHFCVFIFFEI